MGIGINNIFNNTVYTDRYGAEKRTVISISRDQDGTFVNYMINGKEKRCKIETFARWAERIIEHLQ